MNFHPSKYVDQVKCLTKGGRSMKLWMISQNLDGHVVSSMYSQRLSYSIENKLPSDHFCNKIFALLNIWLIECFLLIYKSATIYQALEYNGRNGCWACHNNYLQLQYVWPDIVMDTFKFVEERAVDKSSCSIEFQSREPYVVGFISILALTNGFALSF